MTVPPKKPAYCNFSHVHYVRLHFQAPFLALPAPPQTPIKNIVPPKGLKDPEGPARLKKLHNDYWINKIRYNADHTPYRKGQEAISEGKRDGEPDEDPDEDEEREGRDGNVSSENNERSSDGNGSIGNAEGSRDGNVSSGNAKRSSDGDVQDTMAEKDQNRRRNDENDEKERMIQRCKDSWRESPDDDDWGFGTMTLSKPHVSSYYDDDAEVEDVFCYPYVDDEDVWDGSNGSEMEDSGEEDGEDVWEDANEESQERNRMRLP